MPRTSRLIPLFLACMLACSGCSWLKDTKFTPSEAEKKLAAFCLKEGNLNIITKKKGATLWIYALIEDPIFEIRPSREQASAERKIQPFSLLSLQTKFTERFFKFDYDVIRDVLAGEAQTYGSGYNETYTKKRQLLYQGLQESFFNAQKKDTDLMPEFIVIVIADITKGLATKSTFYLEDLKRYITEAIPADEYYIRELNEILGQETLIGDKLGKRLSCSEVAWPYFLTKQMENRIRSKVSSMRHQENPDPAVEMAKAMANTLRFYPFTEYDGIVLFDVRGKQKLSLTKENLKAYAEKNYWEDENRKLTTIRFQMPKDPASDMVSINTVTTGDQPQE